jgi:hypothetical protein
VSKVRAFQNKSEPELPIGNTIPICTKRKSIRITLDDLDNPDSKSDNYIPNSKSDRDSSLCDGLKEVGFTKSMAKMASTRWEENDGSSAPKAIYAW